ncbi:phosphatidate cytidylyltransferase [Acetivibrio clariflavus]|uniref:Phosphatidate cytidylyltransferase n=1 Tax=Acetivibrio clariflavus (strain DSM 19732 / NBRC 101661 / EBR45) TaxID=720554 RepID=G8LZU6_ACECE|nr:phosphatidate cytidylyltransferase [Acetivibrio clariflavus]AEV69036.1 CDP-diglyceride synthetase [Acetivibrio clariflavus DSM 19732]
MKVRIASGIAGIVLLLIVVWSGKLVLGLSVFLLSVLGLIEFYSAVSKAGYKPVKFIGYIASLYMFLVCSRDSLKSIGIDVQFLYSYRSGFLAVFSVMLVLFCYIIFLNNKYNIFDISVTVFSIFYIVFLFSFVVLVRNMVSGFYYVWLVFIGAFATDTFAYFSGYLFGKHKLLPEISPKKTVEGSIGGIVGCAAVMGGYGLYLNSVGIDNISMAHYIVLGLLCGVISQIGDWAASAIKRHVKIKDYGNIMPGHGGVLDRFDSILFTAPVVYFYLSFLIF